MKYPGNINITVWIFVFWCWIFVTRFFIHKFYCIGFHFRYFDYKSLIISRIKNKQNLICYCNAYFSVGFSQNGKTEYNYVHVFTKYFRAIVPYCTFKSNILFLLLNLDKSLEQIMGYRKFLFATGAWLKQPVNVCIG